MSFLTKFFEFYKMYKEGVFDSIGNDVTKLRVRETEIWANLNNLERDVRTSQTRLCEIKDATVRRTLELPGNVNFVAALIGAPAKDKIKPGIVFVGAKKKETVKAFFIVSGEVFQGAEGHPQTADKGGAYIVSDASGMRLVQADVFNQAYALVSNPVDMQMMSAIQNQRF